MSDETCLISNAESRAKLSTPGYTRIAFALLLASLMFGAEVPPLLAAEPLGRTFSENRVAEFYRGRTVRIVVGFSPGGGFDINTRALARHINKHIPGNPTVIVENRPGAGSLIAANLVYKNLPQDGTYIGSFHQQLVLQQLLGRDSIEFDSRAYSWLGNLTQGEFVCAVHKDTGVTHINQIRGAAGRTVNMGALAPGSGITDATALLRAALGLRFRIVYGYGNSALIARAIQGREVDGMCVSWEAWTTHLRHMFEPERTLNVLVATGSKVPTHPWIDNNTVAAGVVAPSDRSRKLLEVGLAPEQIAQPYAVGPGVPADRVAALRNAFDKTMADPAFVAFWEKIGRAHLPRKGEEVARIVDELFETDAELIAQLREVLKEREGP